MGLYDRDYWKERQTKDSSNTKYTYPRRFNKKKQIHPLFWVFLAFVIIIFWMSKLTLPSHNPYAGSLVGKATIISPESISGGLVVYADAQGHFRGTLKINDITAPFMIDTGATTVTIPVNIANQARLKIGQPIMANTAGGTVLDYLSTVDKLAFGNALLYNVPVAINQHVKEILIGVDFMKLFKITHNRDSMMLVIENGNGRNTLKAFDPHEFKFSKIENDNGSSKAPLYPTPNEMLTEKTKAQTTWTKTMTCDKNGHCKTSYH
jgi:aspartyl protease family protein